MFLFATSQAIAASQVKQRQGKAPMHKEVDAERPRNGRGLLWRLFDALAESRRLRARVEIERQRRLREGACNR
jgi:hypothetical protein